MTSAGLISHDELRVSRARRRSDLAAFHGKWGSLQLSLNNAVARDRRSGSQNLASKAHLAIRREANQATAPTRRVAKKAIRVERVCRAVS